MSRRAAGVVLVSLLFASVPAHAAESRSIDLTIRGRKQILEVYTPSGGAPVRGTVIMGSGDVGWVGLAVTVAELLAERGFVVAGVNVRKYLASYSEGKSHVTVEQIGDDYRDVAACLKDRALLHAPLVFSGVSEGAAIAVAAAASRDHAGANGVLTMGLPASAELAWHWTDISTWITKRDASEPSFRPADVIARVAPRPLWMIQSTRDEYVKEAEYRRFQEAAGEPKRLVLINASDHRFTDRLPELEAEVLDGLAWIASVSR